jgi:hypothetical protein
MDREAAELGPVMGAAIATAANESTAEIVEAFILN